MTHAMLALSLGFGGVILATEIAFSAPQCDSRDRVLAQLADNYGETRQAFGVTGGAADDMAVMELYASDATGTWSVTVTLADGQMCLIASGAGFEALSEDQPAPGEKI